MFHESKIPSRGKPKGLLKLVGGPLNSGPLGKECTLEKAGASTSQGGATHRCQNRPECSGGSTSPRLPASQDCIGEDTLGQ